MKNNQDWQRFSGFRSESVWCPGGLKVRRIYIPEKRIAGYSIFYFSDTHFRTEPVRSFPVPFLRWHGLEWIEESLHEALSLKKPDTIIFGGDLAGDTVWLDAAFQVLKRLPDAALKLAVPGNWDLHRYSWITPREWYRRYEKSGFRLLSNESYSDGKIFFHGTDDWRSGAPRCEPDKQNSAGLYSCLLTHNPDTAGAQQNTLTEQYNLILSGHTHGGQWRLPGYGAILTSSTYGKKFEYGAYRKNETTLLVSAGIGTTWHPCRIFCPPEVMLIEFTEPGAET